MIKEFYESKNLVCASDTQTVGTDLTISSTIESAEYTLNKTTTASAVSTGTFCNLTLASGTYTITVNGINNIASDNTFDRVFIRDSDNNIVVQDIYDDTPKTFTVNANTTLSKIVFVAHASSLYANKKVTIMLNEGSRAFPYEPYGDTWNTKSYVKSISGSQTYTKFPIVLRTTQQSIPTWNVKGNMEQSGTPSPSSPIYPSECGDLSENLYDASSPNIFRGYYNSTTNTLLTTENNAFIYVPLVQGKKYYVYGCKRYNTSVTIRWVTISSTPFYNIPCIRTGVFEQSDIFTITAETNENYLALFLCGDSDYAGYGSVEAAITANCDDLVIDNGYKLDIKTGLTTTPVYLGEVQSTRRIKKYEFTGNEAWYDLSETGIYYTTNSAALNPIYSLGICDRFVYHFVNLVRDLAHGEYLIDMMNKYTWFRNNDIASLQDWKTYLQQQYAAGTPVTVWYVLTTSQTTTLNEPLRRIGNYADTITNPVTIPTTSGINTIDVDTTLKPSEMSLTFDGYKVCKRQRYSRTENLFDYTTYFGSTFISYNEFFNYAELQLQPNTTYTLSTSYREYTVSSTRVTAFIVATSNGTPTTANGGISNVSPITITTESDGVLKLYKRISGSSEDMIPTEEQFEGGNWIMLNTGSTAKPYQPYLDWE